MTTTFPVAERIDHTVHFGHVEGENRGNDIMKGSECLTKADPYYWLRDDKRENPKVLEHLKKENQYMKDTLLNTEENQKLYEELKADYKSNISENYESAHYPDGNQDGEYEWLTFWKNKEGDSHRYHYLEKKNKATGESEEYLLLDENSYKDPEGKAQCNITGFEVSHNHKYMMFCIDRNGSELYDLLLFDISDLNHPVSVEHKLPKLLYGSFEMDKTESFVFYHGHDESNTVVTTHVYDMKTGVSKQLFDARENNPKNIKWSAGCELSSDETLLFLERENYDTGEKHCIDMSKITSESINSEEKIEYQTIIAGKGNQKCYMEKIGDYMVFRSNEFNGIQFPEYTLTYAKISNGDFSNQAKWDFIDTTKIDKKLGLKATESLYYSGLYVMKNFLLVQFVHNGIKKFAYTRFLSETTTGYPFGREWKVISPQVDSGVLSLSHVYFKENMFYLVYSSMVTPHTVMKLNPVSGDLEIVKEKEIPNYDPSEFVTTRMYAPSHDGKQIPMSIVYHKDLDLTKGPHKLHLYGYGSYGYTVHPTFSSRIIPMIKRKFVYVIAHVRGSRFLGNSWYEDGRMLNKKNTFLDFVNCAQHLIEEGITTEHLLSTEGRSAGGLLAGHMLVKYPFKFNAVVAGVPFVDVLTTMADPSIPLTTEEWSQWGNPNNRKYFEYMKDYSPYDSVKEGTVYPNFFLTCGLHDPRVGYWEPTKLVALMRHYQGKVAEEYGKLQVMDIEMNDGHFSSSDRYKWVDQYARMLLFIILSVKEENKEEDKKESE